MKLPEFIPDLYVNLMIWLTVLALGLALATYYAILMFVPVQNQTLATSISVAFEGFAFGGAFGFLLEGRRITHRDRMKRIVEYHTKVREFVLDKWLHGLLGEPSGASGSFVVRRVLGDISGADARYYVSAKQHLEDYKIESEREAIMKQIAEHNPEVEKYEKGIVKPITTLGLAADMENERKRLSKNQGEIWKRVQVFGTRLQEVIYDFEDDTYVGECYFERQVKEGDRGIKAPSRSAPVEAETPVEN